MKINKISIKHFIGDLPRLLNENFKAIADTIISMYDEETKILGNEDTSIVCKKLEAKEDIITSKDVKIILDGKTISLIDIYKKVTDTETDTILSSRNTLPKKNLK
jgi:hypothetical protein